MPIVPAALGAAFAAGILLTLYGGRRLPRPPRLVRRRRPPRPASIAGAVLAAATVAALTGWPVAAAAIAATVWFLPTIWGAATVERRAREQIEAVATWAEMLRDTLSAAAGLEQTIQATAPLAPPAIRRDVTALADALRVGARLPEALTRFAQQSANPTADLVAAALIHAASNQAAQLADRLAVLANAAREQATARDRIAAERARTRSAVRIIVGLTLTMVTAMTVFNRPFLAPYSSPTGQLVLAGIVGVFAAAFWWLHRLGRLNTPPRVLDVAKGAAGGLR
ncbi:type II secretion system F family protein [Phytohabitans houttuyneae]|uniref:Type II secretion system protein GspF domain-containing protein n=1 Tax=Phytohabitans houttuyneae TaxID=1076126 RepID=A0A6V8KVI3_9ACTN|nr:type II secretion system F family protein [Phytohabitans houttuyneae]GFJ85807.1 hypothetical protein Phou_099870 [Phytohabitans houttuyneae]